MGSNQSNINTRTTNYKKFRITDKREFTYGGENWLFKWKHDIIVFSLDEYIEYANGRNKEIHFSVGIARKVDGCFIDKIEVGDYLEINLNEVNGRDSGYEFFPYGGPIRGAERKNSDGSIFQILLDTNEYLGGLAEIRQGQIEARNYGRWASETQSWTSYNLPPNW